MSRPQQNFNETNPEIGTDSLLPDFSITTTTDPLRPPE